MISYISLYEVIQIWKREQYTWPCPSALQPWLSPTDYDRYYNDFHTLYRSRRGTAPQWTKNVWIDLPSQPKIYPFARDTRVLLTPVNRKLALELCEGKSRCSKKRITYRILREQEDKSE